MISLNYSLMDDLMNIIEKISKMFQISLSHEYISHRTNYKAIKYGNVYNLHDYNEIKAFFTLEKAKIEKLIFKMIEIGIVDKNGKYI